MKSAYFVIIFSFLIIFTASFVLEIKPAEARGADEPCSYTKKNSYIKISYNPQTGKAECKKVSYWVPEKCGIVAGLYKTDKDCQPPQQSNKPDRDRDGDGYPDKDDSCPREYSTTNNGCPPPERDSDRDGYPDSRDSCPREFSTTNNGCPPVQTPSTQSEDWTGPIVGIIIASIIVGIIIAIVKKKKPKEIAESIIIHYACPACSAKLSEPDHDGSQNCENCGWRS